MLIPSQLMPDMPVAKPGNDRPPRDDEYLAKLTRAMRRALKRAADYAIRHDDPAATADEALRMLRAELVWRFELLRSRQRQPALIVPEPLPTLATVNPANA